MNLKAQTLQGITWAFATRMSGQAIQYGVSIVIARILFPADFGLVGMVGVFTGFAAVFIDFGIGSAIVQRQDIEESQLRAAFAATLAMGILTSVLIGACAPLIAAVYHRHELVALTRVSSAGFLLSSIGVVPRAMLLRAVRIKRLMLLDFAALVASSICSIVLALAGAGVWTIVVSALVMAACQSILPVLLGSWKARLTLDIAGIRPLLSVSLNLLGFTVINYWSRNADNLLIGRLLGETSLGLYARAYSLMLLPITQISGVLGSSMVPMFSRVQTDISRSKNLFLRALGMIALVGFPMTLGLTAVADPFVRALYGPKWIGLIPLLRVLAVVGALQILTNPTGWIFVAQGRTNLMFRWGLGACTAIIVAISVGAYCGSALSVAVAYLVINSILVFPCLALAGGLLGASLKEILRAIAGPALCVLPMAAMVVGLDWMTRERVPAWLRMTEDIVLGAGVYSLVIYRARLDSLRELIRHVRERLHPQPPAEPRGNLDVVTTGDHRLL